MKDKKKIRRSMLKSLREEVIYKVLQHGLEGISYQITDIIADVKSKFFNDTEGIRDVEQSWKAFKGKLLESILKHLLEKVVEDAGLVLIGGSSIEKEIKEDKCLMEVKKSLLIDYGEYGMHLPDADLIIYCPKSCKAVAIISVKATLRERIAQTGYWCLKLKGYPWTRSVKVFFMTLDEDGDLNYKGKGYVKKSRAIVEKDTDGAFVLTDAEVSESEKVMKMEKFKVMLSQLSKECK